MIRFQAKYIRSLARFMAHSDIRFYLNGFLVESCASGGAYLVATNGHIMLAIHDAQATCGARTVLRADAGLIAAAGKTPSPKRYPGNHPVWADYNPFTGRLMLTHARAGELYVQPNRAEIEVGAGTGYPIWQNVMPDFSKLERGSVEPVRAEYLAQIMSEHPVKKGGYTHPSIELWRKPGDGGINVVQFIGAPEMVALLMGMRRDHVDYPAHANDNGTPGSWNTFRNRGIATAA